jgi:transposase
MTPENYFNKRLLLPSLKLLSVEKISNKTYHYHCQKKTTWEVCRKCPTKSYSVHDSRQVTVRDAKIFNKNIRLIIKKRRFRCPNCKSVFTELIDGIKQGFRTTEKYRNQILHDFKHYENVKSVAKQNRCSDTLVHKVSNERLELELRKSRNTPWGKTICVDEHSFKKSKKGHRKEFVTAIVDNNRKCLRELARGKDRTDIIKTIEHIPGKENVTQAVIDMDSGYKNFITSYFPNAKITVDKFHVIRLIFPAIQKSRKQISGDARKNPVSWLLLTDRKKLKSYQKRALTRYCNENPKVGELYRYKERIANFYRIKGSKKARRILIKITDDMAKSELQEIKTLRKTLMKWRDEILRYFETGITNARVEGFNRKCKLLQRKAYGFRSFENYKLRALYFCS